MTTEYYLYLFNQDDSVPNNSISSLQLPAEPVSAIKNDSTGIEIYSLHGNEAELKSLLYESSHTYGFDYCLLPKNELFGPYKLVVFDMDSTLIPIEVIDELAVQAGVGNAVSQITEAAMRGELDFNESLEQRVFQLKGMSEVAIESVISQLEFNPGIERFCHYILEQQGDIAIASGGFMPFAKELANRLPFSKVMANNLIIEDGVLTGEVSYPIVNADVKADCLKEWLSQSGGSKQNVIAVGDGANDLKMLQQAGIGVAYKAKPTLGKSADCVINIGYLDSLIKLLPIIDEFHH